MPPPAHPRDDAGPPRGRLQRARLCVLIEGGSDAAEFERLVATLIAAGVPMLQIRDKFCSDRSLLDRVERALAIAGRAATTRPLVIVNDRVDVAAAAGADGVHLGETDLPVPAARRLLGPAPLIGRTAHDLAEAEAAVGAGADYLGIGPCFPSTTKAFDSRASQPFLRAAARLPLPSFAIGGITPDRLTDLARLGLDRVAVAAAVTAAADPAAAASDFLAVQAAQLPG
jgi:thiamine-phosphate pyrophosphorylase